MSPLWSACVVPTVKHGEGGLMMWRCFAGDTVCDLFRIQGTLNQHGFHSILQQYTIPSGLRLLVLSWSAVSDDLAPTITWPQPNGDGLGWVGPQSEGKSAKCSAYVGTPSRLLEKHSSWSWLRECKECAKLSSRQRVAIWRISNVKYILICLTLFWLLYDSICVIS